METVLFPLGAYLFGSIPTGLVVVKLVAGIDIRTVGSGNIGATNVSRALGKRWAYLVGLFDMAKVGLVVLALKLLGHGDLVLALSGLAGVLGHCFPVWLGFRGGKGVSTAFGVLFAYSPPVSLGCGLLWFLVFRGFGYVSVASLASMTVAPVAVYLSVGDSPLAWSTAAIALVVWFRHRSNIRRLIEGRELKAGKGRG